MDRHTEVYTLEDEDEGNKIAVLTITSNGWVSQSTINLRTGVVRNTQNPYRDRLQDAEMMFVHLVNELYREGYQYDKCTVQQYTFTTRIPHS